LHIVSKIVHDLQEMEDAPTAHIEYILRIVAL